MDDNKEENAFKKDAVIEEVVETTSTVPEPEVMK